LKNSENAINLPKKDGYFVFANFWLASQRLSRNAMHYQILPIFAKLNVAEIASHLQKVPKSATISFHIFSAVPNITKITKKCPNLPILDKISKIVSFS